MKIRIVRANLLMLSLLISFATTYVASRSEASPTPISEPNPFAPNVPSIPKQPLVVHGPFEVSAADLTAKGGVNNNSGESSSAGNNGGTAGKSGGSGEPAGPQTPKATTSFVDTAGLRGLDPSIAAGPNSILISDDSSGVAVYDKSGSLLGAKPGQNFANPFNVASLFSKLQADANPTLNPPNGLPPNFKLTLDRFGDIRVMFDSYRKRFWIYAMMKNGPPWNPSLPTDVQQLIDYPAVKLVRRDKAAVAVSKTEDPRDGFYTYWWNETIHNGECNLPQGCNDPIFKTSGEGADYPAIGISPKYFLATIGVNRRDPSFKTDTAATAQAWMNCQTQFQSNGKTFNYCGPFYVNLMVVSADALASGCAGPQQKGATSKCDAGRAFPLFVDARNYVTDRTESGDFVGNMARGVKPVVMQGPQTADGYFVNNFIDRPDNAANTAKIASLNEEIKNLSKSLNGAALDKIPFISKQIQDKQKELAEAKTIHHDLVVWTLSGDNLVPALYPIKPFTFDNFGDWRIVLNSAAREGKLYATFNQCFPDAKGCPLGVRVLRVNTGNGKTEIDRTFGLNSTIDDGASDLFHYSFPGIAVNKYGDIVIVYRRYVTGFTARRPEVRFSVWYHDEPDVRPSRLLKAGEAFYPDGANVNLGTDTAGVSVDPSDDGSIWIAQMYSAKDNSGARYNRIVVGKILGGAGGSGK